MQMKKNYVIFDPYYTNREGAWYFSPDEGEFCQGKACYGFGSVKYFDGSVYIGELYYDGVHPNEQGYVLFEQAIAALLISSQTFVVPSLFRANVSLNDCYLKHK